MTYASDYDKLMLLMKRASKNHSQRTWNSIGTKQDALIKAEQYYNEIYTHSINTAK